MDSPSRSNFTIRLAALFAAGLALASLPPAAMADDCTDLMALAQLEGSAYKSQRDALLASHPAAYDVAAAVACSWDAGLAAFILNGWKANGSLFQGFESEPIIQNVGPGYLPNSSLSKGEPAEAFLIEQVWKTSANEEIREDAYRALLRLKIDEPIVLWNAVAANAPPEPELAPDSLLKAIAIHAFASDDTPASEAALEAVLSDAGSSSLLKTAALTGLGKAAPSYATSVLVDTFATWGEDVDLLGHGLRALAFQPASDSVARNTLYSFAQSAAEIETRLTAIASMSVAPQPGDIPVLQDLQDPSEPQQVRDRATISLFEYS